MPKGKRLARFLDRRNKWPEYPASSLFCLMDPRVRGQRGTQPPFANTDGSGRTMPRHREHLMALVRQLTSSASLKCKVQVLSPLLLKWGHVAARRCPGSESKQIDRN